LAGVFGAGRAQAQVTVAEPEAPIEPVMPANEPLREAQIVLQLVVGLDGGVESAVVVSHAPEDVPEAVIDAAVQAAKAARFTPSTRDGRPIRSRIEYVVVVRPRPGSAAARPQEPAPARAPVQTITTNQQDEDYAQVVQVHGTTWSSPRGLGDVRVSRELLDAAPHQQVPEMLSAAPGFFVDHEDGEGLGNDVYLRGFDLDHGSGIEMRVGSIPINAPSHIQGQGYADANFIIPEVLRSVRVLEGPYDPRQGDAAIVGSAYFDLGVPERGYQAKATYGSFDQWRVVGVAAPRDADEETFAAFSLRQSDGFGQNRASKSGSAMAQYGFDLGPRDHLRLLGTAYGARSELAGVVRQDDVDAGRIGFYDSYPSPYARNQSVASSRVIFGVDFDHVAADGTRFEFAPWLTWTDFRARQNYTGNLESSQTPPYVSGLGDLFETANQETAAGLLSRVHSAPVRLGRFVEVVGEPGVYARAGHTDQSKSLVDPSTLSTWDRRLDDGLQTLDLGAYLDLDVRLFKRVRISGGPRADFLAVDIDDRLAPASGPQLPGATRHVAGVAAGPRVSAELDATPELMPVVSYGEGFRSLDAAHLHEGDSAPYSKVRSIEGGLRSQVLKGRYVMTASLFRTWVGNELVFEPEAGGLETQSASTRSGFVGSLLVRPFNWLLASAALSIVRATFETQTAGGNHYVPNIPPVLFRVDVSAHGTIGNVAGRPIVGRVGAGYTFLAGRHLTDAIVGPSQSILNLRVGARYGWVEVGVEAYNALGLAYADDEEAYISNWGVAGGQPPASFARHIIAAPPRTVLGSVAVYF
jgi:hypothetical protein